MRSSYSALEQGQGRSTDHCGMPVRAACASTSARRTACMATRSAAELKRGQQRRDFDIRLLPQQVQRPRRCPCRCSRREELSSCVVRQYAVSSGASADLQSGRRNGMPCRISARISADCAIVIPERLKNRLPSANDDVALADGPQIAPPGMSFEHGLLALGALQVEAAGRDDRLFRIGVAKLFGGHARSRIHPACPSSGSPFAISTSSGPQLPMAKKGSVHSSSTTVGRGSAQSAGARFLNAAARDP